ncbi:MAG: hypothetical protein Q9190_000315 [Brigantiaea leucoxantha]
MSVLIGGRILQGLGAGGLDVLGEVILADITTLKERPLYLSLFAIPMAGGGVGGPIIGAAFSDTTFALPLSWAGAMYPWSSWRTILPLVIAALVLTGFGVYEGRATVSIFPYRIFGSTTAVVTLFGATIHGVLLYSVLLYAPLFYQAVLLETPFKSAVSLLPAGISIVGFSIFSAVAVEIIRRYRWVIIFNWLIAACGVGLWALWGPSSSSALRYGLQVTAGIGIGTLFTVLTIPMQASVRDVDDQGIAAGILVSFRLFGGLLGLSISSTVFSNVFEQRITSLGPLPASVGILNDGREAIAFIPMLESLDRQSTVLAQLIEAYRASMMAVFLMLSGFGAVGFFTSFLTRELTLEKEDLGRQRLEKPS